jgi:hypothetical protein
VSEFSSDSWCTPEWLAKLLGFFDLDPCSNERSHILAASECRLDHALVDHRDGLAFDWSNRSVFCNPPYSDVMPWARKLSAHGSPWVALVKLDPTTKWWAQLMAARPRVAPFRKRIKFEGNLAMTANFPSVLVWRGWTPCAELTQHLWLPTIARAA